MSKALSVGYVEERKKFLTLPNPHRTHQQLGDDLIEAHKMVEKAQAAFFAFNLMLAYDNVSEGLTKLRESCNNYEDYSDYSIQLYNIYN